MATTPTERARPAERHGQGSHCHICRKLIVWPGLCYSCATGRPRTIFRPDEREIDQTVEAELLASTESRDN